MREPRLELWAAPSARWRRRRRPCSRPRATLPSASSWPSEPLGDEAVRALRARRHDAGGRRPRDLPRPRRRRAAARRAVRARARSRRARPPRCSRELEGCETIRIRGRAGTDLTLRVAGRPWLTDATPARAGRLRQLPRRRDLRRPAPRRRRRRPRRRPDRALHRRRPGRRAGDASLRARAASSRSTAAAQPTLLRELVESAGDGADVVAELGIGLNPAVGRAAT